MKFWRVVKAILKASRMAPGIHGAEWHKSTPLWGEWDWALPKRLNIFVLNFVLLFWMIHFSQCINYCHLSDWCSYFPTAFISKQPANSFGEHSETASCVWAGVIPAHKSTRAEETTWAEPGGSPTPLNPIVYLSNCALPGMWEEQGELVLGVRVYHDTQH